MINKRKLNMGIMHMVYAVTCPYCDAEPLMRCANGTRAMVGDVHWSRFGYAIELAQESFNNRKIERFNERLCDE